LSRLLPLLGLAAALGACQSGDGACEGTPSRLPSYPDTLTLPTVSIPELLATAPDSGRFNTSGVVIDRNECPPCPPEQDCAPCVADDRITLATSGNVAPAPPSESRADQVTVRVRRPCEFQVGRAYTVSVEVQPFPGADPAGPRVLSAYNVRLLGYVSE
jgi:hypothetical protein